MKENSKKSLVLIIITISAFMLAIIGATYAYFATSTRIDANIGVNIETAGTSYTFTATSDGSIDMSITAVDMSEANVSTEKIKTGIGNIDVSLASPSDDIKTTCTYDIIWVWDSSDKYTIPDMELPYYEKNYWITKEQFEDDSYECDNGGVKDVEFFAAGIVDRYCMDLYNYEFSTMVDSANETDLSELETGITPNSIVLKQGASITSNSTTATEKTHVIEANIYNLPVHQANLYDKNFKAHITIENVNCSMTNISDAPTEIATYLTNNVYNSPSNQASIASGKAGLYKHTATLANGANDNSYRYAGSDALVNNYVCFSGDDCTDEDNLYRIISVDSNNKIKVIKATNIEDKVWNNKDGYTATGTVYDTAMGLANGETYENIWAIQKEDESYYTSSLNDYLNGEYLTSLGNKANLIETTTWSVGGASNDDLSTKNVHDFMVEELNQSKGTYDAKIGLMYASEYGFAALPGYWEIDLDIYDESLGRNWLFTSGYQWMISRDSESKYGIFCNMGWAMYVEDYGNVYTRSNNMSEVVHPTFSLVSSVKILNAADDDIGTKTNPMIIM